MRGQAHAHVDEVRFEEAGQQAEQEEKHAMPHQTTRSIFHRIFPFGGWLEILRLLDKG
jgi:hypothetical protein